MLILKRFPTVWINTREAHARVQLEDHLARANHPGGLNETLTDEDFGITMARGSLSPIGMKMSPSPRGEGPIWYGLFPTLIEPVNVSRDPSNPGNWVHVINCYVNLVNKQGRRSYLQQHPMPKMKENEAKLSNIKGKVRHTRMKEEAMSAEEATWAEEATSAEEDT